MPPWRRQPHLDFFFGGQNDWHGLFVDRPNDAVRFRGEEAVQLEIAWTVLDLPNALPSRPEAGEKEQRAAFVAREPIVPLDPRFRVFVVRCGRGLGKASHRHDTAIADIDVLLPVGILGVADIRGSVIGLALHALDRRRHAPKQVGNFTLAVGRVADDRGRGVWVNVHRRR